MIFLPKVAKFMRHNPNKGFVLRIKVHPKVSSSLFPRNMKRKSLLAPNADHYEGAGCAVVI
jgi:hypothetical protein